VTGRGRRLNTRGVQMRASQCYSRARRSTTRRRTQASASRRKEMAMTGRVVLAGGRDALLADARVQRAYLGG